MPTDFYTTDDGIEFTDTNDIRTVSGEANAERQLAYTVKRVVKGRSVRTRTERSRLIAALRDALRDNPYADEVGQIDVERNEDESLIVTIQIGSDDFEIQT